MTSLSDIQLIQVAQRGNREAIGILYQRHLKFLLSACYTFAGGHIEPLDLVHEAWIRVIGNLHRCYPQTDFRAWAATIARNLGRDSAARRLHHRELINTWPDDLERETRGSHEVYPSIANRDRLKEVLAHLSERQQLALRLHLGERRSSVEVAKHMGCAPATVRSTCYFALKRLKSQLISEPNDLR